MTAADGPEEWPFNRMSSLFDVTGLSALPDFADDFVPTLDRDDGDEIVPVNWNRLGPDEARQAWTDLNAWVTWLRKAFGLPPTLIPPLWHRHDELVWELSALHTHWLACYGVDASPSAPIAWMRDFADARHRYVTGSPRAAPGSTVTVRPAPRSGPVSRRRPSPATRRSPTGRPTSPGSSRTTPHPGTAAIQEVRRELRDPSRDEDRRRRAGRP